MIFCTYSVYFLFPNLAQYPAQNLEAVIIANGDVTVVWVKAKEIPVATVAFDVAGVVVGKHANLPRFHRRGGLYIFQRFSVFFKIGLRLQKHK